MIPGGPPCPDCTGWQNKEEAYVAKEEPEYERDEKHYERPRHRRVRQAQRTKQKGEQNRDLIVLRSNFDEPDCGDLSRKLRQRRSAFAPGRFCLASGLRMGPRGTAAAAEPVFVP
jgi:hypothetical protein